MKLTKQQETKEKKIKELDVDDVGYIVTKKIVNYGISSLIIILLIVLDGYVNNGLSNLSYLWVLLLGINAERTHKWIWVLKSHYERYES